MKVVAAFLLAVLSGKACPTSADIKVILNSGLFFLSSCLLVSDSPNVKLCMSKHQVMVVMGTGMSVIGEEQLIKCISFLNN